MRGSGIVPADAGFSFLETSDRADPPDDALHTEAFHVDTHPGRDDGRELHRLLVDLGDRPRGVRIGRTVRADLLAAGLVTAGDLAGRDLPPGTPVDVVGLAPYDGETVHGLSS